MECHGSSVDLGRSNRIISPTNTSGNHENNSLNSIHTVSDTGIWAPSSPPKIKVYKSRSYTFEHQERNNNKNREQSWITWAKCMIGFGTEEECKVDILPSKSFSAPAKLTLEETTELVEKACSTLKDRLAQLETRFNEVEKTIDHCKSNDGGRKKKNRKTQPYLQFYSQFTSKPPKVCPQAAKNDPTNQEEEAKLRCIATRSRSPTPGRKKRRSRSRKRARSKTCFSQPQPQHPAPAPAPGPPFEKNVPTFKMYCTPFPACNKSANEYNPRSRSQSQTALGDNCYKPPKTSNNPCEFQMPQRKATPKPQRPRSVPRKPQFGNNRTANTGDKCPCKGRQQKFERGPCSKPGDKRQTRSCNPFCRPANSVCTANCGFGNDTNCVYSGLGTSYNRSKSGDSLCKQLLAKYNHTAPGENDVSYGSYKCCPYTDEQNPVLPIPGMNRTNSSKPSSDNLRFTCEDPCASISYATQPKDKEHHKAVHLRSPIYTPCVKQIGPRSPVVLFHALKKTEIREPIRKPPAEIQPPPEMNLPKPPFTMEVLEKEILEHHKFGTKKLQAKTAPMLNTNNGALTSEVESPYDAYIGHLHEQFEPHCCRSSFSEENALVYADSNNHIDYLYPEIETPGSDITERSANNNVSDLPTKMPSFRISCRNNNFGDENFRFFRQYLNITPAQTDSIDVRAGHTHPSRERAFGDAHFFENIDESDGYDDQDASSEISGVLPRNCRMDQWILGEFPEEISKPNYTNKTKKKSTFNAVSHYGITRNNNKKISTRTGKRKISKNAKSSMKTHLDIESPNQAMFTRSTDNMKHSSPRRQGRQVCSELSFDSLLNIDHENTEYMNSPRKTIEPIFSEEYTPQVKLDAIPPGCKDFIDSTERSPRRSPYGVKNASEPISYIQTSRLDSPRKSSDKQVTFSSFKNMISPKNKITKSEDEISVTHNTQDVPEVCNVAGESSVDGDDFLLPNVPEPSTDLRKSSGFLSRLSSMWKSKPKDVASVDINQDVKKVTSELILDGKESSVDLDSKGSSVDMVNLDGSSNNGYSSIMEESLQSISHKASEIPRNVHSIEPDMCVQDSIFEAQQSNICLLGSRSKVDSIEPDICVQESVYETRQSNICQLSSIEESPDEDLNGIELFSVCNDESVECDRSGNNGGDNTDDGKGNEVNDTKVEHNTLLTPVTTTLSSSESSETPIGTAAPSVISARGAMNLKQLLSSSGVAWTKIGADDVDVASIRCAKEEFMKRLKMHREERSDNVVEPVSDKSGDVAIPGLSLDQPVASVKKTPPSQIANDLTDAFMPEDDAAAGTLCLQ